MEEMKKQLKQLKRDFNRLSKMEVSDGAYWSEREKFVIALQKFLRLEFTKLSKDNLLWLCDRVSTYRPVQPFSFLVTISMRKK